MNGENAKFIFQWELLDNTIGLGAHILLEALAVSYQNNINRC